MLVNMLSVCCTELLADKMKFLIAFALFAVAFADVEPFRLREAPAPAIDGYVDYPYVVEIVQSTPIAAQESAAVPSTANIVKVVDFIKGKLSTVGGVKASFDDAEPSYDRTVQFVDEAVNEEHGNTESLVKGPAEKATPSDINVNFVDEVINDLTYDKSIKDEESPLEEAGPVNFVNEAVNKETSDTELAPSFNSYAGISKLIEAAQNEKYVEASSTVIIVSPEVQTPSAVNVVENAVNMGQILRVGIEENYEDSVSDGQDKAEANDDDISENVVRVAEYPRGKVYDNPLLR